MSIRLGQRGSHLLRLFVAASIPFITSGCHQYRVRSQLISGPTPPEALYRCVQLELGRAAYAIVGADRASGWLHAQKRIVGLLEVSQAEIYATVIPDGESGGSHLQLTDNSHAEMDADRIRVACLPESRNSSGLG